MNNSGQVSVELKLLLDKLRREAKQAADIIRESLKSGTSSSDAGLGEANKKMDELERRTKRVTSAIRDQRQAMLDAWRKTIPAPVITDASGSSARRLYGGPGAKTTYTIGGGLASSGGGGGASAGGGRAAAPPGSVPPAVFGIGGAAGGGGGGGNWLSTAAQVGAALAGLRVIVGAVRQAFSMLLAPMRAMLAVAESARQAYANALRTGVGLNTSIQSSMISSALGVGQSEVYQYAEAFKVLNERMKFSIRAMQETNRVNTDLAWSYAALKASSSGYFAKITAEVAPAMRHLMDVLKSFADAISRNYITKIVSGLSSILINVTAVLAGLTSMLLQVIDIVVQSIVDSFQYFIRQLKNTVRRKLGLKEDDSDPYKETKEKWEMLGQTFNATFKRPTDGVPAPVASMGRLASSAWEKMGLVLGNGGANHAQQTAANTKRIAGLMEKMVGLLSRPGDSNEGEYNYSRP